MTEKRPGPAPAVRLIEVSVKRELTVVLNIKFLRHIDSRFYARDVKVIRTHLTFHIAHKNGTHLSRQPNKKKQDFLENLSLKMTGHY